MWYLPHEEQKKYFKSLQDWHILPKEPISVREPPSTIRPQQEQEDTDSAQVWQKWPCSPAMIPGESEEKIEEQLSQILAKPQQVLQQGP